MGGEVMQAKANKEMEEKIRKMLEDKLQRKALLLRNLDTLKLEVQARENEMAGMGGDGVEESHRFEEETKKLTSDLAEMFARLAEFARWRGGLQSEMAVFGSLLDTEMERGRESRSRVRAKVSSSTVRRTHSVDTILDRNSSDGEFRRESGYLSPGPTSNFLEHLKSDLVSVKDVVDGSAKSKKPNHVSYIQIQN